MRVLQLRRRGIRLQVSHGGEVRLSWWEKLHCEVIMKGWFGIVKKFHTGEWEEEWELHGFCSRNIMYSPKLL